MASVQLLKVRIAFPALFEAKSINDGDPRFGANFIIQPGSKNAKALAAAMDEVAEVKWKTKSKTTLDELKKKGKVCFVEDEKKNSAGETYNGFEDMYHISANNASRPTVIDGRKQPLTQADGKPYGGCYVNAIVDIWAQDNKFGKRINATLTGVQFHSDGDAFGGGAPASPDQFPDLGDTEDGDEEFM
jgi:hypothetical protein